MKIKSIVLLIVIGFLGLALTACAPEDIQFLQAMLEEWASAKNANPTNKDGSLNPGGIINAGLSALDLPGGDDEVKAAIDAKGVVDSIKAADEAAEKAQKALKDGKAQEAVNLLDATVKDRPNDWWLLDQRGVANIEAGNSDLGSKDLQNAYGNAKGGQVGEHQRQLLFESIARQRANGGLARCGTYRSMALAYYDLLNSGTGDATLYAKEHEANLEASRQPGVTCR